MTDKNKVENKGEEQDTVDTYSSKMASQVQDSNIEKLKSGQQRI